MSTVSVIYCAWVYSSFSKIYCYG